MSDATDRPPRFPRPVDLNAAARALDEFLRALGLDETANSELVGTGERVAEAFAHEFCAGEGADFEGLIRPHVLPLPAQSARASRNIIWVREVPVHSMCPHHLLPSEGTADVAYEPGEHLVGIGAIAALVELASRRLILQETLGQDVIGVLTRTLAPRWVALRLELTHSCLRARGERAHGARVETWSSSGEVPDFVFARGG